MAKNFGYSILRDESIDFDRNDKRIANYLVANEPSIKLCIGCGSCTATCSAGHFTQFNIRRIQTSVRRGEAGQFGNEIKKCMFCGKCQLVCPRGVNLRNVILTLNRAFELLG
jgi:heterodisulfide reductase subunit C